MKQDQLTEIVEVLAGRRGAKKDHAVRHGSLEALRAAIRTAVVDAQRATARLERISDVIGELDSGSESLIEAINLAQEEAEDAAAAALAASETADGVREDHDALVGNFVGSLPTKFSELDTAIGEASQSAAADKSAAEAAAAASQDARDEAQAAASNADGSASAAAGSASNAQTYRDQAGGYASAASASAVTASQEADDAGDAATAASESASSAATFKDDAEGAASAAEGHKNTAQTAAANASTSAGSAASAATAADEASAEAATYSTLAVSVVSQGGTGVVKSQFMDRGWNGFQTAPTRTPNELHPVGETLSWDIGADVNAGATMGWSSSNWISHPGADAYVIEVEYTLESGSLAGAGVMFDWNTDNNEFRVQMALADMTSGSLELGRPMVARAVFKRPSNFTGTFTDHDCWIIASYTSFGTRAAKHLKVHRLNIRVATAEELGGGEVGASFEEFAYAKADVDSAVTQLRKNIHAGLSPANEVHTPNGNNPDNLNSAGERVGQWSNATASSDVPSGAPSGAMSIEVTGGQAREMPGRLTPLDGRTERIAGWVKSNGQFRFAARNSDGDLIPNTSTALESHATWTFVTRTIEVPSGQSVADWCPGFDMPNNGTWVRFYDLRWQDVTEVNEAAGQLAGSIEEIRGIDIDGLAGTALGVLMQQLNVQADGTSAAFTSQASAIADLEGNSSVAVVSRAKAGGAVGEIELVAFEDAESGESASTLRFSADDVLFKGSVGMDLLKVGLGRNLVPNANFEQGLDDWTLATAPMAETVFSLRAPGAPWAGARYPTAMIYQSGNGNETARVRLDVARADGKGFGIPVKPGVTYEATAKLSTIRCSGRILIAWCDANGDIMGSDMVLSDDLRNVPGSSTNPEQWPQMGGIATAPAGAAFLRMFLEKDPTNPGLANSYLFFYQPQIVQTHADAVDLTPFAPGGTTLINGGNLITNSVTADRLNVTDLSAISANLGSIRVDDAHIENLTITSGKYADGSVLTPKVADNAITASGADSVGNFTPASGNETEYATVVVPTVGNRTLIVWVDIDFAQREAGGTASYFRFRLRKDGSTIRQIDGLDGDGLKKTYVLTSTVGSTSIGVLLRNMNFGASVLGDVKDLNLVVLELKK